MNLGIFAVMLGKSTFTLILTFFIFFNVKAFHRHENPTQNEVEINEERILFLIDSVLSLKNPPKWVVEDLQRLIKLKYETPEGISNPTSTKKELPSPNQDLFACWNTSKINPFPDSIIKSDTGTVLVFTNQAFCMPFAGEITSPYGYRDKHFHKGIDIDLNKGNPVKASFDGVVRIAKKYGAFGNVVVIRHRDGLETVYAHLSRIKVKTGDKISSGTLVGLGGNSGRSSGSHLHFEIRYKGVPLNPSHFISFNNNTLRDQEFLLKKTTKGFMVYPVHANFHKVKKGESLSVISQKYGLTILQLKSLNGMPIKAKSILVPGQLIRVS
jgi:murein DD-endopeptidase MepM/ murein hydrolase activator NlpD